MRVVEGVALLGIIDLKGAAIPYCIVIPSLCLYHTTASILHLFVRSITVMLNVWLLPPMLQALYILAVNYRKFWLSRCCSAF